MTQISRPLSLDYTTKILQTSYSISICRRLASWSALVRRDRNVFHGSLWFVRVLKQLCIHFAKIGSFATWAYQLFCPWIWHFALYHDASCALLYRGESHDSAVLISTTRGFPSHAWWASSDEGNLSFQIMNQELIFVQSQIEDLQDLSKQFERREAERMMARSAEICSEQFFINLPIPVQQRRQYWNESYDYTAYGRSHRLEDNTSSWHYLRNFH